MEKELEELEQQELDKDLLGVGASTDELPEVPTGEIKEPAAASKEKKKGMFIAIIYIRFQFPFHNVLPFNFNLKLIDLVFLLFLSSG